MKPAIGTAYAVLSNTEKRQQYDQYGEEQSHPTRQRQHQRHDFEADISPEDLFNMFFGGGFPSSKDYFVLAAEVVPVDANYVLVPASTNIKPNCP